MSTGSGYGAMPARIGPKVFADVPSAKELEDARRAADVIEEQRQADRAAARD